ncbi:methionine biosynthesis protein MetW [bacterium]|nr:methionine biosynthesis protein MetW [Candidatus Omnitrophota bacterium]MBU2527946.1 methionine biosynthesis protein MetW [bacterium]MBU3929300.1 methionine biosynthesis protein MetW [bacterium]MBU4122385.1 methionine biosynthesis protein MetW [bacterium]
MKNSRIEHRVISDLIPSGSKVLELGCGEGALLELLVREKEVRAQGLEINEQSIYKCVEKGLSVLHGDIEGGLSEYKDKAFDFVIMDRTFQELKKPAVALDEALRVGQKVIAAFPNFVHYKARLQFFFKGKVPVTEALPYEWYNTPNLHFLSVIDFFEYCAREKIRIEKEIFIGNNRRIRRLPNLFAEIAVFLLSRGG